MKQPISLCYKFNYFTGKKEVGKKIIDTHKTKENVCKFFEPCKGFDGGCIKVSKVGYIDDKLFRVYFHSYRIGGFFVQSDKQGKIDLEKLVSRGKSFFKENYSQEQKEKKRETEHEKMQKIADKYNGKNGYNVYLKWGGFSIEKRVDSENELKKFFN